MRKIISVFILVSFIFVFSGCSSSYSSRVTLRSSYKTLSISEVKSMLKRRDFFELSANPSGDFGNDFRSKTISGVKVVIDRATGLMWHQGGSSLSMTFDKVKEWIRSLNSRGYAGHSDWRLPTLEEAASILESSKMNGNFYIDPVFSEKQLRIWTGDKYSSDRGEVVRLGSRGIACVVSFYDGSIVGSFFGSYRYVRPVRRDN